jgi:fucose 4-O-acetylase-like acetyltransferase
MPLSYQINNVFTRALGLSLLQKKRLNWVDYLRGIVVILVVYHHARVGIERSGVEVPEILVTANIVFYSFRIPLFFFVSGIFFAVTLRKLSTKKFITIKFENLLYPYLIWSFIQITAQIILSNYTNSDRTISHYLYIFYQPRMLDQFYYLPALFNVTMVCLIIKKYIKPNAITHLLIAGVFYMVAHQFERISIIADWMIFYMFFAIGDVLSNYFFKPNFQNTLSKLGSFLIALPIFAAVQFVYLKMDIGQSVISNADGSLAPQLSPVELFFDKLIFLGIVLVGCFTVMTLAFQLQKWKIFSYLRVIGYHSLHIYVMHVLIIGFVRVVMKNVFNIYDPVALLIGCIIVGVIAPIIFYNLVVRTKWGWFLFHFRKPEHASSTPGKPVQGETTVSLKPIENIAR